MKGIFKSPRFYLICVIAILQSLPVFGIIDSEQANKLIDIISLAIGGMITVRTIDKTSEAKEGVTTVSMPENVTSVKASTEK